jgi:nitrate reductase NapAB chaperone NapD
MTQFLSNATQRNVAARNTSRQQTRSLVRRIGISALLGTSISGIGVVLEAFAENHPILSLDSLDNFSTGVLAALLVFAYEQKRYQTAMDKLRVIAEMNHHVRNALQGIVGCRVYSEQDRQVQLIVQSVKRIEWALREVLPGDAGTKD